MCRIIAVTVVYYPDKSQVRENISKYIDYIDKLIIWDNTPATERERYAIDYDDATRDKISVMTTGKNEGIAYPVNRSAEIALKDNFDLLMIMDQDSTWVDYEKYIANVKKYHRRNRNSIFVPNINNRERTETPIVKKRGFINSGTIFPVSTLLHLGHFNEYLFVDGVDMDYSIRAIMADIEILCMTECPMIQQFGYPIKSELLKCQTSNYPAGRTYDIVKNHILLYRKYKKYMTKGQKEMIFQSYILKRSAKVILLEKDKFQKLKHIIKGAYMGFKMPLSVAFPATDQF